MVGQAAEGRRITTKETLTSKEAYRLVLVRDIDEEVQRLTDRFEELHRQTISSPKMDGMPRGGSQGDAMASMLVAKQQTMQKLENAKHRLEKARRAAQRVVRELPAPKRLFYTAYYIDGDKLDTACSTARISESTAYRYMRAIGDNKT